MLSFLFFIPVLFQEPVTWTVAEGAVSQPQVAVAVPGETAVYHVAYAREGRQVMVRSLTSAGIPGPELALSGALTQAGMRRGPRIAAGPQGLCVSTIVFDRDHARDGDLMSWISADGGLHFDGPFPITDQPNVAREGLHDMAVADDGTLACVWRDLRHGSMAVYAAFSADGGRTWTPNAPVYRSPDGAVCECCAPTAAFDSAGRLLVMFRNSLAGKRDMWLARGGSDGFKKAEKLGKGSWALAACPMAPGALAPGAKSSLTFWLREDRIFRCAVGDREDELGSGRELAAAGGPGGAWAAWVGSGAGALMILGPTGKVATAVAENAHWPVLATAFGRKGLLALAWEEHAGDRVALKLRVLATAEVAAAGK